MARRTLVANHEKCVNFMDDRISWSTGLPVGTFSFVFRIENIRIDFECILIGDFALVKAWKGDTNGNLVFRGTTQNFNIDAAKAGKITIAEVEELVEPGEIHPGWLVFVEKVVCICYANI